MRSGREVEAECRGREVAGVIEKRIPHIALVGVVGVVVAVVVM